MVQVYCRNSQFSGQRGVDVFVNGVAEVAEAGLGFYLDNPNYSVGEPFATVPVVPEVMKQVDAAADVDPGLKKPLPGQSVDVWRAYAKAQGIADADSLKKNELIELVG